MSFRPAALIKKLASRLAGGPVWRGGPSDIVATLYDDGVILATSGSADEIIGAAGNLVGRSIYDFVARDDRAAVRAVFAHAAERGVYADPRQLFANFHLLRVRRAAAPCEIVLRPLGRGRICALIRERAAAVNAPSRSAAPQLVEAVPQVASDPGVSTELMADLAHEMKTPLNAIMGFADAMRAETFGPLGAEPKAAEKYCEYAGHIHASGAHLTALIGAVQDFAKAKAGHYTIEKERIAPGVLVEECAAMIRGAAEAAGLSLDVEIAPDLPEAMLDARVIRQVLVNLLSNAVKFTEAGSVTVKVSQTAGALDFVVSDTGIGMNNIVLAKLGGRWSDTHQDGVRGTGGAGLGLSLAFDLARQHGGVLKLESAKGEGTTARLTVPVNDKTSSPDRLPLQSDIQSQLDRVNAFRRERAQKVA